MAGDRQRDGGRCAGGADGDLLGAVLYWPLGLEFADMKTIIEMAGKAFETQGVEPAFRNGFWTVTSEELERFAELVRADERERIKEANAPEIEKINAHIKSLEKAVTDEREAMMQLFTDPENQPTQHDTVTVEYMKREIADEREECAKLCDAEKETANQETWYQCAKELAKQIRARGNT